MPSFITTPTKKELEVLKTLRDNGLIDEATWAKLVSSAVFPDPHPDPDVNAAHQGSQKTVTKCMSPRGGSGCGSGGGARGGGDAAALAGAAGAAGAGAGAAPSKEEDTFLLPGGGGICGAVIGRIPNLEQNFGFRQEGPFAPAPNLKGPLHENLGFLSLLRCRDVSSQPLPLPFSFSLSPHLHPTIPLPSRVRQ